MSKRRTSDGALGRRRRDHCGKGQRQREKREREKRVNGKRTLEYLLDDDFAVGREQKRPQDCVEALLRRCAHVLVGFAVQKKKIPND